MMSNYSANVSAAMWLLLTDSPPVNMTDDLVNGTNSSLTDQPEVETEMWRNVVRPPFWSKVLVAVVLSFIALCGILGNGAVIRIVWCNKSMRNIPNIFITSLAMADLLVLVSCVPITIANYFLPAWVFGNILCKLMPFIQFTSIGVSIFTLTAMSHDRYRAIVKPMSIQANHALRRTNLVTVLIWVLSMALATPDLVLSYVDEIHRVLSVTDPDGNAMIVNLNYKICRPTPPSYQPLYGQIATLAQFSVLYCLPLTTIGVFYVMIARNLVQSSRNMPTANKSMIRQLEARKNVAKTVLILVGIFALCWLPVHIVNMWRWFSWANSPVPPPPLDMFAAMVVSQGLMYSNSCVNPLALFLLSKSFRTFFYRYLFCCCRRRADIRRAYEGSTMRTLQFTVIRRANTMSRTDTAMTAMTVI
ncbi:GRPR [Branchiostoma lanceolatum]|uniref:Gastrin-releasing peptide receptor n=1 Tax=Branchiostoma lanceolatum TaxID=7740 RepID=A0A8J9VYH6_BRALA|nr:GRPR [Branchiostoma lanceolatum]